MDFGSLVLTIVCLVLAYLYGKKDNTTLEQVKVAVNAAIKQAGITPPGPTTLGRQNSGSGLTVATPTSADQMDEYVKALEAQNRDLQRQLTLSEVSNVVEVDQKYGSRLKPGEIETIRAIFALFDVSEQGWIRSSDLMALHAKLGEPLTDGEAQQAINELDPEGKGAVTFNKFLYWWYDNHKNNKKGSQYTARFKLLSTKLKDRFDADRVITQESGTPYTLEYRISFYYKNANQSLKQISVWHDVPLYRIGAGDTPSGQIYNFICEIPKWTRAKFEIATGEPYNPIKQDTKNGQLRFYKHGDMMFNYGCFPQTWEDPAHRHEDTQMPGDNDPIDALEIGCRQIRTGQIVAVKILGILAMIDDGETDWKVICIAINDPLAFQINDIDDVETYLPGAIHAIREYLRDYKNYAGGAQNRFALREQAMPRDYATKIVEETHKSWLALHQRGDTTVSKSH